MTPFRRGLLFWVGVRLALGVVASWAVPARAVDGFPAPTIGAWSTTPGAGYAATADTYTATSGASALGAEVEGAMVGVLERQGTSVAAQMAVVRFAATETAMVAEIAGAARGVKGVSVLSGLNAVAALAGIGYAAYKGVPLAAGYIWGNDGTATASSAVTPVDSSGNPATVSPGGIVLVAAAVYVGSAPYISTSSQCYAGSPEAALSCAQTAISTQVQSNSNLGSAASQPGSQAFVYASPPTGGCNDGNHPANVLTSYVGYTLANGAQGCIAVHGSGSPVQVAIPANCIGAFFVYAGAPGQCMSYPQPAPQGPVTYPVAETTMPPSVAPKLIDPVTLAAIINKLWQDNGAVSGGVPYNPNYPVTAQDITNYRANNPNNSPGTKLGDLTEPMAALPPWAPAQTGTSPAIQAGTRYINANPTPTDPTTGQTVDPSTGLPVPATGTGTGVPATTATFPCLLHLSAACFDTANPADPFIIELGAALVDRVLNLLPGLLGWQVPSHTSQCFSAVFTFNNNDYDVGREICNTFEVYRPTVTPLWPIIWASVVFSIAIAA